MGKHSGRSLAGSNDEKTADGTDAAGDRDCCEC